MTSFGGSLGMGEKYHPLPWGSLDYFENRNPYVVKYTKEQLDAAPGGSMQELTANDGLNSAIAGYLQFGDVAPVSALPGSATLGSRSAPKYVIKSRVIFSSGPWHRNAVLRRAQSRSPVCGSGLSCPSGRS